MTAGPTGDRQSDKTGYQSVQGIAADLRRRIINGEYAPGQRLPVRSEFEAAYGASSMTVLRAFQQLMEDGFVSAKRRVGSFVALNPPHLTRFGFVFGGQPLDPFIQRHSKFSTFLHQHAMKLKQSGARNIEIYNGVDGHADSEDYQRLAEDVRRRRLAGMIFSTTTFLKEPLIQELLDSSDTPTVSFSASTSWHRSMKSVWPEHGNVATRAFERLEALGRKNVAVFLTLADDENLQPLDHILRVAASHGLTIPAKWIQPIHPMLAHFSHNVVQLLMNAKHRPDAILILDDLLVEHVTGALSDLQIKCPRDVQVIAHANFPYITPSHVEAVRLGFDVPRILSTSMELIDQVRRGEPCPDVVSMKPLFEDEWAATGAALRRSVAAMS